MDDLRPDDDCRRTADTGDAIIEATGSRRKSAGPPLVLDN
jgi:hypothetical protein